MPYDRPDSPASKIPVKLTPPASPFHESIATPDTASTMADIVQNEFFSLKKTIIISATNTGYKNIIVVAMPLAR